MGTAYLLRRLAPRSLFGATERHPAASAFVVSNRERIGVFSQSTGSYVEYDRAGRLIGHWRFLGLPYVKLAMGAGLTASGDFYARGYENSKEPATARAVVYRLDRESGKLVEVALPSAGASSKLMELLGTADGELVFYAHPVATVRVAVDR